ncbi:hypothetical protein [Mangrovimicrobium sediminis]|uniref:hypothetical protein n=1 Tax=Mangrovimicrobium sediminis TaxID=2562682 RepID=UPI0014366C98|nr:hypothetical protein [Haliea sp. SAOS-164]
MDLSYKILVAAHLSFAMVWLWALGTMYRYIMPGKGWSFALLPIWLVLPEWFDDEGKNKLKIVRAVVVSALLIDLFAAILAGVF